MGTKDYSIYEMYRPNHVKDWIAKVRGGAVPIVLNLQKWTDYTAGTRDTIIGTAAVVAGFVENYYF